MSNAAAAHRTPQRPDTTPVIRYTSQTDYRTGDLKLGRTAVLRDLRRYLQVPFDNLVKCVGATPSQQDLQQIHRKFRNHLLTETGLQWKGFLSTPAKSQMREDATFEPLGRIVSGILAEVSHSGVSFLANPNETPLSQRSNTSRPDGCLVLGSKNSSNEVRWFDIAVPFEFKKSPNASTVQDDKEKMIWSLHSIMREDPCRRFAFGISIEDTQLRLWPSNRALLAVSEPINFLEDIDAVISLFYALGSASATDTKEGLGWDPTVERVRDGEEYRYKFTVGNEVFTTTRELATYGADSMVGRATRVYEAVDAEGKRVVIKDSWREAGRRTEGDILKEILASCRERLSAAEAADAERHFVGIRLCKKCDVDVAGKWIRIEPMPALSATPHLPSTGDVPDSGRLSTWLPTQLGIYRRESDGIPRRVHTRTVFYDVGVALKDITHLAKSLSCLGNALKALYYLHKAGWVYRDFSVGNVIWVDDDNDGIGKLSDFEYAKKVASDVSHDVRMGTMHFMAVEVEQQAYLFHPKRKRKSVNRIIDPPFRMNILHDIEFVWWAFAWILFYHTDKDRPLVDLQGQQAIYQQVFPGVVGQASRLLFFTDPPERAYQILSETCRDMYLELSDFAISLQDSYQRAEKSYPVLQLDDALLEDIHSEALSYLNDAWDKAGDIKLYPVHELLRNKKRKVKAPCQEIKDLVKVDFCANLYMNPRDHCTVD